MILRSPRSQLCVVSVLALASLAALLAFRPEFSGAMWSRGDDLALVAAWTVAAATSAWLFAVTGACLLALGLGRPRLARRLAPALPRRVRQMMEIAIVTACVALPTLPAGADAAPNVSVAAVHDQPVVRAPSVLAPVASAPVPRSAPALPRPRPENVVVRAGDNLWLIARAALERGSTDRVDDDLVARYWRVVVGANRSTLRSGDPSLIFPGEVVTLPPAPRGVS